MAEASFVDRRQKLLACIASIAVLMLMQAGFRIQGFIGDAAGYWALSSSVHFGITPSSRGYVFPLLLMPLRWLCDLTSDPLPVLKAGLAVIYGILLPLLVPAAFRAAFGGRVSFLRRTVPVVLLALLFPGLLVYPLSDLPALLMTLGAILCCIRALEHGTPGLRSSSWTLAAGVLAGAAYNTRPIYLFTVLGLGLFVALAGDRGRSIRLRAAGVALFAAGLLLVSLPQAVINKKTLGVARLTVITGGSSQGVFASQLVWGITMQRYETFLGPVQTAIYTDPAGMKLLEKVRHEELMSIPRYFGFALQNPLAFTGIYSRHVMNGLDVRDGEIYTSIPSPERNRIAVFNFCVLALAVLVALTIAGRGWSRRSGMLLGVVLLPVAAIIPGAVETRFFLPLHLLAYWVIAGYFDAAVFRNAYGKHALATAIATACTAAAFFAVTTSTMAQLQYAWPDNYNPGGARKP